MVNRLHLNLLIFPCVIQQGTQNTVSTFAEHFDLTIGSLDDNRHPFPVRIKLNDIKKLKLINLILLVMIVFNYDFIVLVPLYKLDTIIFGSIDEAKLIGTWAAYEVITFFLSLLDGHTGVTECKVIQESLKLFI